jgi:hypothetical protein
MITVVLLSCAATLPAYLLERDVELSSWIFRDTSATELSLAGTWNLFVGAPLVRTLIAFHFWRLLVWTWFLFRISRWDLSLNALHYDGRCGLRFLGETQLAFTPLLSALAVQLGCALVTATRQENLTAPAMKLTIAIFVVAALACVCAPLFPFARNIWLAKERAEQVFSVWAAHATDYFASQIYDVSGKQAIEYLDRGEISSICDASSLFDRVHAVQAVPIDMRTFVQMSIAAIVPLLAPIATLLPLADFMSRIATMLM